jgi:O-antigen ligase
MSIMDNIKINNRVDKWVGPWMAFGFFEMLSGLYIFPSINAYITSFYLLFLLPSLIVLTVNFRALTLRYFRGGALLFLIFVLYLALSSLWGDPAELTDNLKRAMTVVVASFGIFYLSRFHSRYLFLASAASLLVTAAIGLFWLIDYYFLMGNSLSQRFIGGHIDYFNLYKPNHYASFYNPLLFSHTLTFNLVFILCLFLQGGIKSPYLKTALICAGVIFMALLLAAQTRMAWITIFVVYSSAAIFIFGRKGLLLAATVLLVSTFILFYFELDTIVLKRGLSYRPTIWASTLRQMTGYWISGHGIGSPLEIITSKYHWYDAHNIYLAILFYSGIMGLLLLATALYKTIAGAYQKSKLPIWFILYLIFVLISGMADGGGLLSRPNAHWFNLVIPLMFLLTYSRIQMLKTDSST